MEQALHPAGNDIGHPVDSTHARTKSIELLDGCEDTRALSTAYCQVYVTGAYDFEEVVTGF